MAVSKAVLNLSFSAEVSVVTSFLILILLQFRLCQYGVCLRSRYFGFFVFPVVEEAGGGWVVWVAGVRGAHKPRMAKEGGFGGVGGLGGVGVEGVVASFK